MQAEHTTGTDVIMVCHHWPSIEQQGCTVCQVGWLVWVQQFLRLTVGSEECSFFSPSWLCLWTQGAWWGLNVDLGTVEGREHPEPGMNLLPLWSGDMVEGQNRIQFRQNESYCFPISPNFSSPTLWRKIYLFHYTNCSPAVTTQAKRCH